GESIALEELPPSNLVFLLDVSGSMSSYNKLPLLKEAFGLLVEQLTEQDRVAIVTYSSVVNLKLPSTSGDNKDIIMQAINSLNAGGSTAGEAGIQLAYETALENFIELGNNRVILATDGDFNVGISDDDALVEFIETKRDDGVYLTVLGFGTGNLKGSKMEKLADNGNGNYAYIDNINEAEKTLVNEIGGTLLTIAKDVKVQVEFNPEQVNSYRLIGYENRLLNDEDFDDDLKDAGDMGAGHSVTALYEINPAADSGIAPTDPNMITLSIRYKEPDQLTSQTLELSVFDTGTTLDEASDNFLFSSAAAQFGLLLRDSEYKGKASTDNVLELAGSSLGEDVEGYRQEFVQLVEIYAGLAGEM
ncbi:MAG: DUF3520 domain-containing protein, partial [candidate division Zixibacteria bacterium]|nr:DUF3520 domain-containing protein [candidate division Zixibacteria bacterium]